MSANSHPGLSTELITQFFKSTEKLATAAPALSSTSRRFHSPWNAKSASICNATLARSIICYYDQAFEYIEAQPLDTASLEQTEGMGLTATKLTTKIIKDADIASRAWKTYERGLIGFLSHGDHDPSSLTEAQRMCSLQAWYGFHTRASLSGWRNPPLCSVVASMDLFEFEQMIEVLHWFIDGWHSTAWYKVANSLEPVGNRDLWYRLPVSPVPAQRWKDLEIRLESMDENLSPRDTRFLKSGADIFLQFMAHEVHVDIKGPGKKIRLADLLPPNNKTG